MSALFELMVLCYTFGVCVITSSRVDSSSDPLLKQFVVSDCHGIWRQLENPGASTNLPKMNSTEELNQ
jgi:hypothetical protein